MKNILITGSDGSAAHYLMEELSKQSNNNLFGISRRTNDSQLCDTHQGDLCDLSSVIRILKKIKPDEIYHLAANADVRYSFDAPTSVLHNNIDNTVNLFEGLRLLDFRPKIMMCSTSEVYGAVKTYPINEDYPLQPANIYAISKMAQENIARYYCKAYSFPVVCSRAFGYINPKRKNIFSTAFAIQIASLEKLGGGILWHGNLESVRTLMDVRDIAKAYIQLLEKGKYGECYNIGSNKPVKVGEILNLLLELSDSTNIRLEVKKELLRPNDVTLQIPDTTKFEQTVGPLKQLSLKESLSDLLDYCRNHYV